MLDMQSIFLALNEYSPKLFLADMHGSKITAVKLFPKDPCLYSARCLYILSSDDIGTIPGSLSYPLNFLCRCDTYHQFPDPFASANNFLVLDHPFREGKIQKVIENLLAKQHLLEYYRHKLSDILLNQDGVSGLLQEAFHTIHYPLLLENAHHRILNFAPKGAALHTILTTYYDKDPNGSYFRKVVEHEGIYDYMALDDLWSCTVFHRNTPIAFLFLACCPNARSDFEKQYIQILCSLLSIALSKDSLCSLQTEKEYFLTELLSGSVTDPEILSLRAGMHGIDSQKNYQILAIDSNDTSIRELIHQELRNKTPNLCSVIHDEKIVLLLPAFYLTGESARWYEPLSSLLKRTGVFGGISLPFPITCEVSPYYGQALQALALGSAYHQDADSLFFYENYSTFHMLSIYQEKHDIAKLIHPALHTLMDYDKAYHTSYTETLFMYLTENGSQTQLAEKNHIHPNTLRYRLHKISDIMNLDITDASNLFLLTLSIQILQLSGKTFAHSQDQKKEG